MKKVVILFVLFISLNASAVFVNYKGFGEALIIPYYTVNNDLNTLVTITNTTEHTKAIKIQFRESFNGHPVLSYNVYLDAFDTWSFGLVSANSTQAGFIDQPSVLHLTSDNSCSPYLRRSGQEFLPFGLETGPQELSRAREGFIEILEMGEFSAGSAASTSASHGSNGVPTDCSYFQDGWEEGGIWANNPQRNIEPPSGGIMAAADLINVAYGINYSIPVTALSDFYPDDEAFHVNPADTELSLDTAKPEAVVIDGDEHRNLLFTSGVNAVSATLMADKVLSTYVLDSIVAGQTDIVYTQPTRRFYFDIPFSSTLPISPPFNLNFRDTHDCQSGGIPSGYYGGIEIIESVFDRESQYSPYSNGGIDTPPPPPPNKAICGSVFVHSIKQPEDNSSTPEITSSENFTIIRSPSAPHATENGFMSIDFIGSRPIVGVDSDGVSHEVHGIPILGVTLFKFSNGNAAEGLLAQYGGSYPLKYKTKIE